MKERIWPAVGGAFAMHTLAISALAFGLSHKNSSQSHCVEDNFCVEVMFHQGSQTVPLEAHSSEKNVDTTQDASTVSEDELPGGEGELVSNKRPLMKSIQKKSSKGNQAGTPMMGQRTGSPSSVTSSSPLFNPPPPYPREARRKKIEGVVMIQVSLSNDGIVADARPLPPRADPILEEAALRAIRQWKFKPGVDNLEVPIEFKLET